MTVPSVAQLINGIRYDFSSIELNIFGKTFTEVQEISYSESLEPGILRGTSAKKLGRTRGEYDAEGSITFYLGAFDQFTTLLSAKAAGRGWMTQSFLITVIYQELVGGGPIVTDVLRGARVTNVDKSHSSGGDALQVTCDLDIIEVISNGKSALPLLVS